MTDVLITGAGGQLGAELVRAAWPPDVRLTPLTRHDLDITDPGAVATALDRVGPDVVVNAAAYTAVDRAESEPDIARSVNVDGVEHLASRVESAGARLVHLSTDYVFDGTKDGWYTEDDPIAPLGVYGTTKALGEERARKATRHVILRTAWVYGALGPNFVVTMRRLAREHDTLRVVGDQIGCPTATADLAAAIVAIVGQDSSAEAQGTFHLASPTAATWHEFALAILADNVAAGLTIESITTADYPTAAARPQNSRLSSDSIRMGHGIGARDWRDALPEVIRELNDRQVERTT